MISKQPTFINQQVPFLHKLDYLDRNNIALRVKGERTLDYIRQILFLTQAPMMSCFCEAIPTQTHDKPRKEAFHKLYTNLQETKMYVFLYCKLIVT